LKKKGKSWYREEGIAGGGVPSEKRQMKGILKK